MVQRKTERLDGFRQGDVLYCVAPYIAAPQKSLGEEVNELTSSRLLKLEKDNQTLQKTVDELRGAANQDAAAKLSKATQENQRLNQRVNFDLVSKVSLFLYPVALTALQCVTPTL